MTNGNDPESRVWQVTPDLLSIATKEGKLIHCNPAWTRTLGYTREEMESCLFFEFIHPEDLAKTAKAFADVQIGEPVLNFVNRYRHKDGSYRWLSWNSVPEDDVYYSSARDITAFKDNQIALASHVRDAELREQFISILGHDLRNPLAGAACAVEYVNDREDLSENGLRALDTAKQSLHRMTKLIDDVLDFARARLGGELTVEAQPCFALRAVLEQTVREIAMAHPEAQIEEVYTFSNPVSCDTDRIQQLVSNLLSNAVFHGRPEGRIQILAQDAGTDVTISVTNQGGTIPDHVRPHLFEPFQRAEPGSSQNGLGLGLYIAKQIATGHGGDITVVSEHGETTFTLRFPRGSRMAPEEGGSEPRLNQVASQLAATGQAIDAPPIFPARAGGAG